MSWLVKSKISMVTVCVTKRYFKDTAGQYYSEHDGHNSCLNIQYNDCRLLYELCHLFFCTLSGTLMDKPANTRSSISILQIYWLCLCTGEKVTGLFCCMTETIISSCLFTSVKNFIQGFVYNVRGWINTLFFRTDWMPQVSC